MTNFQLYWMHLKLYSKGIGIRGIVTQGVKATSMTDLFTKCNAELVTKCLAGKSYDSVFSFQYNGLMIKIVEAPELSKKDLVNNIFGTFYKEEYESLPVEGRDVVDIGALFGDTAIYFAARGAKKVYSFEPDPTYFDMLVRNAELNFSNARITPINEALGERSETKTIDFEGNTGITPLQALNGGVETKFVPLSNIVSRFSLSKAALKLDCEGAELSLLTDKEALAAFDEVILEYHYGYADLVRLLEMAGFKIKSLNGPWSSKRYPATGILYASRN